MSLWKKCTQWFGNYSRREQWVLASLAITCVGYVLFHNVWEPVHRSLTQAERSYVDQQELYQWMQEHASLARQVSSATAEKPARPLSGVLTETAKEHHITIKRLEMGEKKASLTLERVSFLQLITWLDMLEREHDAVLLSVTISKTDAPGIVNADLQVKE